MKKQILVLCSLLSSCTVGPHYQKPETNITDCWIEEAMDISKDEPIVQWWKELQEPLLNRYIEQAAENNENLLAAISNILQARALRQMKASNFYPKLNSQINGTRFYLSENGPLKLVDSLSISPMESLYNFLFDATWEIDLFGKTRRSVESAQAHIESVIEDTHDLFVSIAAEIARNYVEMRGFQEKERLIQAKLSILHKKFELIDQGCRVGYFNQLDLEKIQIEMDHEKALLPLIRAKIHRNIYAISVLIGHAPETLLAELLPKRPIPRAPKLVKVGLKSDLLRRRADIRKAERQLAEATAEIGVAIAELFPSFNLFASGGLQSLDLSKVFSWDSKTGNYGAGAKTPLFQGGNLLGNWKAKEALAQSRAHTYQQVVLNALEEAERSLMNYTQSIESFTKKKQETFHYQRLIELSQQRQTAGLKSLFHVIEAEIQFSSAEEALIESQLQSLLNVISLYKALGGGWQSNDTKEL